MSTDFYVLSMAKTKAKNKKLKDASLGDLRLPDVKLATIGKVILVLTFLGIVTTFFLGFDKVEETNSRTIVKEITAVKPLEYTSSDEDMVGFSPGGSIAVSHVITVKNIADVDGLFTIESLLTKGNFKSRKSTIARLDAGEEHVFELLHIRPWTEYTATYDINPENLSVTKLEEENVDYVTSYVAWDWPW